MNPTDMPKPRMAQWLLGLTVVTIAGSAWLLFSQKLHEHMLEINTPAGTVRIISNRSRFRIDLPGTNDVQAFSLFGYDGLHMPARQKIFPMQVDGVGITRAWQQANLSCHPPIIFSVNGHEFKLESGKIQTAGQVWILKPGTVMDILVDRLQER